jgi:polyhydroxybutyrate depolymerase
MQTGTGLNQIADQAGFLVVYPKGTGSTESVLAWNAGKCCGDAVTNQVDDIAFVRQILADVGTLIGLDPKRIYAMGFSNGAMFAYRLACEMSDTFAAIAPVSGVLVSSPCLSQKSVSVMHVHGLSDQLVPYAGGTDYIPGGFPSVEKTIDRWAHLDGCTSPAQVEKLKNIITHTVYASCEAGSAVELYTIDLLGHAWPSVYVWSASQSIWNFFAAHPKP